MRTARIRLLHPTFFTNEDLLALPALTRLLFAGLWTLADREGRLEDRPLAIKLQLFPTEELDVDAALTALEQSKLITRYQVKNKSYIHVITFKSHQHPHPREAASVLPAPIYARGQGRSKVRPRTDLGQAKDMASRAGSSGSSGSSDLSDRKEGESAAPAPVVTRPHVAADVRAWPTIRSGVDDAEAERAGNLVRLYQALYTKFRHGARYRQREHLDWHDACSLVALWDDATLAKLAEIILTTDDVWIAKTDRSFKIFALKCSWADDRLKAWEVAHGFAVG